ncbi:hypothetical protein HRbin33_01792 [bacterium HR33]|nr:hypothetical protein HRbin33_01792 [bacterium HR33]
MKLPLRGFLAIAAVGALGCIQEPAPRELTLNLLTPNSDDGAVMFTVSTAAPNRIVSATPVCEGCKVFYHEVSEVEFRVIVTGPLRPGPVAKLLVSDAAPVGAYRVDVHEVAARDFQTKKPTGYTVVVER